MKIDSFTGFVAADNANLFSEIGGSGTPFVMIHAGVADHRQWDNEFAAFAKKYRVMRYDMRGYGKSEPVEGDFTHMADLEVLLETLHIREPMTIMGCSMGGGIAMDFTLTHPALVKALIMVGSAPSGLDLDVPETDKFADVEKAIKEGNLDLANEIETQIWFDGTGRTPQQVNQKARKLLSEMNRIALGYEALNLGKRKPNLKQLAAERLPEIACPVLVVVGANDTPYILAAADYMETNIKSARKVVIEDAAHLPNMEHPQLFDKIVNEFLDTL